MFGGKLAPTFMTFDQSIPLPMTEVVGGVTYIGYCKKLGTGFDKPEWLIIRITETGGLTTPEYANGNNQYDSKWSERATLKYSR
jgi:hypothetical protein